MGNIIILCLSIMYLGVTLTKHVKDLYDKNLKTLKKEMEEDLKKWENLQIKPDTLNLIEKKLWNCLELITTGDRLLL